MPSLNSLISILSAHEDWLSMHAGTSQDGFAFSLKVCAICCIFLALMVLGHRKIQDDTARSGFVVFGTVAGIFIAFSGIDALKTYAQDTPDFRNERHGYEILAQKDCSEILSGFREGRFRFLDTQAERVVQRSCGEQALMEAANTPVPHAVPSP